jgi:hypothetical protein
MIVSVIDTRGGDNDCGNHGQAVDASATAKIVGKFAAVGQLFEERFYGLKRDIEPNSGLVLLIHLPCASLHPVVGLAEKKSGQ